MTSAYTAEQIDRYLDLISLPQKFRPVWDRVKDIELLNALHTHQLSRFPYENLSIHYSKDHVVSLDPQRIYEKVRQRGRGGYCMENSIFYLHVLRGLGFNVYPTGARVRPRIDGVPQGDYMGWMHMVNIVKLDDGTEWMVDVSFGGDGAIGPMPLRHGVIRQNIGSQEVRLIHDTIDQLSNKDQKLWIYQYRNDTTRPWNSYYCFTETEFAHVDFEVMNYYTSTSSGSFQTWTLLAIKFLRDDDRIYGKVMAFNNIIKRNTGGKSIVVEICETEADRVTALKEHFGIELTDEEVKGIRGTPVALPEQ